jgi:beta-glucosidase
MCASRSADERGAGAGPTGDRFPDGFLWGAATSAFQIEGSPEADGARPSHWHRFAHIPGRVLDGSNGDIACDHYRRWREDVAILRDLGLGAYRFSIAWGRVLPDGRARVNRAGLDFYHRLIDALLENGIRPCPTLHHWDLPAALDDLGGWLHPDSPSWFADYARVVFRAFGDRVPLWTTINEPWVIAHAGYLTGVHAPGHRSLRETAVVSRNLLLAHALAVQAGRGERAPNIGLVVNIEPKDPSSDREEDRSATERADIYMNRQFIEPALLGRTPEGLAAIYGDAWTPFSAEDLSTIHEPIDFLGINYYTRMVVRRDDTVVPDRAIGVRQPGRAYTETGWEVHAEGLTRTLLWVRDRYGDIPLYVTENGAAFPDPPCAEGEELDDPDRAAYLREHLRAARAAIDHGVDLRGYFVWSLLDNMEWACGYTKRFGIVHVDFETERRTMKSSARFYREVALTNGAALASGVEGVPKAKRHP